MTPQQDDRVAWRHVPWGGASGDQDFILTALDWHTATFAMQVRPTEGDTASPLVSLATATAGLQGISATYDAGYLDPDTHAAVGATIIRPQIDKATLEAIAAAADPSAPLALVYDLHVTPPGLPLMQLAYGQFLLKSGATI